MAYIFPKRKLRSSDVLDPVELNQDFAPAAELASGNLDQHNFSSSVELTVASEAYWKTHYVQQEADPGMGSPGSENFPIPDNSGGTGISTYGSDNNGVQIPNDGSWGAISDLTRTLTTGTVSLFIVTQVQYFWEGWDVASNPHDWTNQGTLPAKVQFALRVNGNILPETITGKKDPHERAVVPVTPTSQRSMVASGGTDMPGPALNYNKNTQSIGPECFPVRITSVIEVPAGTQTVEVVMRRLPLDFSNTGGGPYGSANRVWAMNRQLLVLEMPSYPISSTSFSSVPTPAFESEDTVSAISLGTERIDKVRDSLNKIQPGATARGAFNHFHLPSMMGAGTQQKVVESLVSYQPGAGTTEYPGFGSTTFATTTGSGVSGWYLVGYGGNDLLSDAITINEPCTLVILGNLQFRRAYNAAASGKYFSNFGCFCIGYKYSTSLRTMDAETEVVVNSYNWGGKAGNSGRVPKGQIMEEINVPLMQVLEFGASALYQIDNIGIYCSSTPGGGGTPTPALQLQRGSLTILHLKKGS